MINNVTLVGRMTKDLDLKVAQSGTSVGNFTLAVNRTYGKDKQEADFITCVAFGKTAEIIDQYAGKGAQIGVVGRIQTRSYENKDGQRVYVTEVVANSVQLLEPKSSQGGQGGGATGRNNNSYTNAYGGQKNGARRPSGPSTEDNPFANSDGPVDISEDDLPF